MLDDIDLEGGPVTRRRLLAAALVGGGGALALTPLGTLLERLAPMSGDAWENARTSDRVPENVGSPYGEATVTYDDHGVPHIEAETEEAAYYAVGFVQAADRLFQMDVLRRAGSGRLSEAFGEFTVWQDVLMTKLDAPAAIEASLETVEGTDAERMVEAYANGVTEYIENGPPGIEFGFLGYEPDEWTAFDTVSVAMAMYHQQTFGFSALREEVKRDAFSEDVYETLFPTHSDHDAPILREGTVGVDGDMEDDENDETEAASDGEVSAAVDPEFVERLTRYGGSASEHLGSNALTVSGEHTESGEPLLCSDPHLQMQVPPFLYRQHVSADDDVNVRGASIPGVPFFFVGETDHGAWGYTTAMGDVIDFYTYETRGLKGGESDGDGDNGGGDETESGDSDEGEEDDDTAEDDDARYLYNGEWHDFETETRTVEVADLLDGSVEEREVEVKKTVHGPFVEEEVGDETYHVGIAWTPLTGNRAAEAMYGWTKAENVEEFRDATRNWDAIPGNIHYADSDGGTLYQFGAKIPIRRDAEGEVVRGDRVFDGSAGEGEWEGFEPYGQSSWDDGGFVPFEELPAAVDADYIVSTNQRAVDDPEYPLGTDSFSGFRAERIYERLDEAVEEGRSIDHDIVRSLQLDTVDMSARELVPAVLDAREAAPEEAEPWLDALEDWDYRMERGSEAALFYHRFLEHFEEATWQETFEERGLSRSYWPGTRVLVNLHEDSDFFDGDRASVIAEAVEAALEEIEREGWGTYGDYNTLEIDHQLGAFVDGVNYPRYPTDGSGNTVRMNTGPTNPWGAVFRMVCDFGGDSEAVLAGGNNGSPFSDNYDNQLSMWADGEYTPLGEEETGEPDIRFG